MELKLTDEEACKLIKILKEVDKNYVVWLRRRPKIQQRINIKSVKGIHNFRLYYFIKEMKVQFQFMDENTKHTLARVNLDNSRHINANGEHIEGHRILIFSEKEYYDKNDGVTHYKAFSLPYKSIEDTNDFEKMLLQLLDFTNTVEKSRIKLLKGDNWKERD